MHRSTAIGLGLFLVGLIGYVAGIYAGYPGRSFSITAVMSGITIAAIGQQTAARGPS